jgi:threonine/homoserine/homoserine lactone efflux protein
VAEVDLFILFIKFIVLGISLAAPVGPINMEMIKRGISNGFWHSWLVGVGGVTADFIFLLLIFFGAAQFMQEKVVVLAMYAVGAIMLVYIGITSMRDSFVNKQKIDKENLTNRSTLTNAYGTGFFIALLNPINLVFWFGVYGSTLAKLSETETLIMSLLISLAIFIGIILWNLNIAFTVHFGRELVNERLLSFISFAAGFCLFWFGIGFAIEFFVSLR